MLEFYYLQITFATISGSYINNLNFCLFVCLLENPEKLTKPRDLIKRRGSKIFPETVILICRLRVIQVVHDDKVNTQWLKMPLEKAAKNKIYTKSCDRTQAVT